MGPESNASNPDNISRLTREVATQLHAGHRMAAADIILRLKDPNRQTASDDEANQALVTFRQYLLDDARYEDCAALLWPPSIFSPDPQSVKLMWDAIKETSQLMVMGAASVGKCLGPDVPVLMFDGTIKQAKDVKVGDLLMGDDSTPRKVLTLVSGRSEMYRVNSPQGSWTCNGAHQLVLECARSKKNGDRKTVSSTYTEGKKVEVEVKDYLGWSAQKKRCFKQYRTGAEFPATTVEMDPYIVGLWLGDGSANAAALTQTPGPALDRWKQCFTDQGFVLSENSKANNRAATWHARTSFGHTNPATRIFKEFVRNGEKRIAREYLINSRDVRLSVLAGLLDSDGWADNGGMSISTKYTGLKDDVVFLARSLGLRAHGKHVTKRIRSLNFEGKYWNIHISGDLSDIPSLGKKPNPSSRAAHRESFTVESIGEGDYCGFTVDGNHRFLLGDFVVTHNSFSCGVWLYLDWLRDPENTNVKVVGPSEDHLEKNLFSHLVNLHQTAAVPSPGKCVRLGITLDQHKRDAGIYGVVVPIGKKAPAKLQGIKVKPRPVPHPRLGNMTRLRIMLEEAEDIPVGIWEDVSNILSNTNGVEQFKIFAAFNPKDQNGACGVRCEPDGGWGKFDLDSSFRWTSVRGWDVVRLDGYQVENVKQGKIIFPGLQTKGGLERIVQNAGGVNTRGYYTFARGAFPVDGASLVIIPQALLNDIQGEYLFVSSQPVAGVDIALEGDDNAVMTVGRYGSASGWRARPSKDFPEGQIFHFIQPDGRHIRKDVIQIDQQFKLPKAETLAMARAIRDVCENAGVDPEWCCVDRTVNGAGVHDYLKATWGPVKGVNPSFSASEIKILQEDTETPNDLYERLVTELWYAARKFIEHSYVKISPTVPTERLFHELTTRQFNTSARGKIKVEAKTDYKSRGHKSPDFADSLTLLIHGVRLNVAGPMGSAQQNENDPRNRFRPRTDATNRFDKLD